MYKVFSQYATAGSGNLDNLYILAPCILYIITTLINLKIFARCDELTKLESGITKYINHNFVRLENYSDNHKSLQEQISQIHQDVSDVKNLLISIVSNRNSKN